MLLLPCERRPRFVSISILLAYCEATLLFYRLSYLLSLILPCLDHISSVIASPVFLSLFSPLPGVAGFTAGPTQLALPFSFPSFPLPPSFCLLVCTTYSLLSLHASIILGRLLYLPVSFSLFPVAWCRRFYGWTDATCPSSSDSYYH